MTKRQEQHGHLQALQAGTLLEEYRIEAVLGISAFGITYLARDTVLEMSVAIKEYFPKQWVLRHPQRPTVMIKSRTDRTLFIWGMACFLREARALLKLKHPNIVQVLRFFEANHTAYMVMDYEHGYSLETVVTAQGLDAPRLLAILMPVLEGLEAVHQQGILHHNLKPDNLYIRPDGSPVLLDFSSGREVLYCRQRAVEAANQSSVNNTELEPIGGHAEYAHYLQQESWVDGYGLAEIAYYAVSGMLPAALNARQQALDSGEADPLVPLAITAKNHYSPALLAAIESGLQVTVASRLTLAEWRQALWYAARPPIREVRSKFVLLMLLVILLWQIISLQVQVESTSPVAVSALLLAASSPPKKQPVPGEIWIEPMTQMSFVWLPSGQLTREERGSNSQQKRTTSQVIAGFWLGQYEVTNEQYRLYQPLHDSGRYQGHSLNEPKQPVVQVNWEEAAEYAAWLSDEQDIFQLPTEAQWEYACRAGTTSRYYWGTEFNSMYLNYADKNIKLRWADLQQDDGYAVAAPVGKFCPNGWHLYDMCGNVWEWMADWRDFPRPASGFMAQNLMVQQASAGRDIRGGGWSSTAAYSQCSLAINTAMDLQDMNLGFRLVRVPLSL